MRDTEKCEAMNCIILFSSGITLPPYVHAGNCIYCQSAELVTFVPHLFNKQHSHKLKKAQSIKMTCMTLI